MPNAAHGDCGRLEETERALRYWQRSAAAYDRTISVFERLLFADGREWACRQAGGEVLEIAAGTGRNLRHYGAGVKLTATDLSPAMLDHARGRAASLRREVELSVADAQSLPFPDRRFDSVVCTLGLCSIPDDRRAVSQAVRVLRPGGRLVLLEHVRSPRPVVRAAQRLLNGASVRLCTDHLLREPLDHVRSERLEIEHFERSKAGIVERVVARKPG